jgi:quercetin dioxygenase-like cupin family protein
MTDGPPRTGDGFFFAEGDFADFPSDAPGVHFRLLSPGRFLSLGIGELPEGTEEDVHMHGDEEQMGYILEGSLEFVVAGGHRKILHEGDVWYCPADVPHGARAVGGPCKTLVVFTPAFTGRRT